MLIGDMNVLLCVPRLHFAIGAPILVTTDNLVVSMAKDSFAFLALFRIIQRNRITNRASDKLSFETALVGNPLLIDGNELWLFKVGFSSNRFFL